MALPKYPLLYVSERDVDISTNAIRIALQSAHNVASDETMRQHLRGAYAELSMFQPYIGPEPIQSVGHQLREMLNRGDDVEAAATEFRERWSGLEQRIVDEGLDSAREAQDWH